MARSARGPSRGWAVTIPRTGSTPWAIRRRPPLPGEHNFDVFVDELGLAANELDGLREQHVI